VVTGRVDESGRALVSVTIRSTETSESHELIAWIDTAFDGELVLSSHLIEELELTQSAAVSATLADGSQAVLESFHCYIEWFGERREVEVVASSGYYPPIWNRSPARPNLDD